MLINHVERVEYNLEEIRKGTLIYAKHQSWEHGMPGIATHVTTSCVTVLFQNEKTNTYSRFLIPVSEVVSGQWELRYSNDGMQTVTEYSKEDNSGSE